MGPDPAVAVLRRAVRAALASHPTSSALLVAGSGGSDSTALAAAVAFEAGRAQQTIAFITIDHGLQPDSADQAKRAAALAYELGFDPVHVVRVQVGRLRGVEAAARAARYAAIERMRAELGAQTLVLLGHTADDQAETVLLGLGRGSGPRSIAGMRAERDGYLRPLLAVRRAQTEAACRALGLDYWDDPHNVDPRFRRVRLRREVLPLLEEVLAGGVTESLARTAGQLQDDLDALSDIADRTRTRALSGDHLAVDCLSDQPRAVLSRVLKTWAEDRGLGPLTAAHVAELVRLVTHWHGQGPIDLPGGYRVRRASGTLRVDPPADLQE